MAGFGPAIHAFAADRSARCECVDARHKAGHDELAGCCIIRISQNTRRIAVKVSFVVSDREWRFGPIATVRNHCKRAIAQSQWRAGVP